MLNFFYIIRSLCKVILILKLDLFGLLVVKYGKADLSYISISKESNENRFG